MNARSCTGLGQLGCFDLCSFIGLRFPRCALLLAGSTWNATATSIEIVTSVAPSIAAVVATEH